MVLAEGRGAVAVQAEDLGQRRDAHGAHAGVAGEGRGQFHDGPGVVHVVVAAGEQGHARGAAQRGRVEAVVLQSVRRQLLQRGHVDRPAEGAGVAEADVVDQHDHHVRCALRRLHLEARRGLGLAGIEFGDRCQLGFGDRQDRPVELAVCRWIRRRGCRVVVPRTRGNRHRQYHQRECLPHKFSSRESSANSAIQGKKSAAGQGRRQLPIRLNRRDSTSRRITAGRARLPNAVTGSSALLASFFAQTLPFVSWLNSCGACARCRLPARYSQVCTR